MRLLRFYGVGITDLFPEIARDERAVIPPRERPVLPNVAPGVELCLLAWDTNRTMMPVLAVYPPGASVTDLSGHEGEIFIYMLEGSLLVERDGHDPFVLQAGWSSYIPGSPPPRLRNIGAEKATLIGVISPPTL